MKIEAHILPILQLYEYAMAIGKSLDYKESCDLFLTLLLKRKNLNAAWIIESSQEGFESTYSIPYGKKIKTPYTDKLVRLLEDISGFKRFESIKNIHAVAPIPITEGYTTIFRLKDLGYLFFYSTKNNLNNVDLNQLLPVIEKFSISLKACKAFEQQQSLLYDLETQNQELSDYAHMVSHDLKSPLRSIDSLTSWLREDYQTVLDKDGNNTLTLIRDNVEKMDTLINGILNYSTIAKNKIEFYDVDLDNLIFELLKSIDRPSQITIFSQELPIVRGDKSRLQQLFQNLIDNAIKYNDKSKGKIEIGYEDKDDYWQFFVSDNGKGIEKSYFEKIFKTFEKLENNTSSTGIGLSIVKKVVELYGGKVWLESEIDKGTTFYFTLKKDPDGTT